MFLQHIIGLFTDPTNQWEKIREQYKSRSGGIGFIFVLAAIPAISGYIGTTQVGWRIGVGDPVKITGDSAVMIAIIFYVAMIVGVFTIGWMIHLLGKAYEVERPLPLCLALAAYTATPLFLIGVMEVYPLLWLNLLFGMAALGLNIRLLYVGVPIMMEIPPERGFLFSSAILGLGLVALVAFLASTAILWDFGLAPEFVR